MWSEQRSKVVSSTNPPKLSTQTIVCRSRNPPHSCRWGCQINGKNVAYTNVDIGIDEIINYRKTGHASKFFAGLSLKPVDLLEIILSDENNKNDSPLSNIVHGAYIFSEDSIEQFFKEIGEEYDGCTPLSNKGIAELASKSYASIGHSSDNSEEHVTLKFKESVMHENFNLEGFVIPLGENIQIEFLPKRKQYQMSSYFKWYWLDIKVSI